MAPMIKDQKKLSTHFLDWQSSENHFLLNPRLPESQQSSLKEMWVEGSEGLEGHVCVLTSGTTGSGNLKWIALSKTALLNSAESVNQHLRSTNRDKWLHVLPDFHVGGLGIYARAFLSGSQLIKISEWDGHAFVGAARSNEATLSALVPAQVYDLVQGNHRAPKSLRAVVVGGGALTPSLYFKALDLGWPLLPAYGMTEACSQIATASLDSIGRGAYPDLEVLAHLEVRTDPESRIQIKGPSLLTAIIEKINGVTRCHDPKNEDWFCSQDRGEVLGRVLKIRGRIGDFIKIGGESVEVERLRSILEEARIQQGVRGDLALLPVPDERLGHVIHLFAEESVSRNGLQDLVQAYHERVLGFEKIRKTHFISQLPRTALGKLISSECLKLM